MSSISDFFFQIILCLAGAIIGVFAQILGADHKKLKRLLAILAILFITTAFVWAKYEYDNVTIYFPKSTQTAQPSFTLTFQPTTIPNQETTPIPTLSNVAITTPLSHNFNLGKILFQEDFNGNANQWPTGTDNGSTFYMDGDEYHIIGAKANESGVRWLGQFKKPEQIFDDFYLETKVRSIESTNENDSYGVLFRRIGGNPYIFVIGNSQQVYSLHSKDETLLWWTYSPKIVKDGTNTIGILCKGDTIAIFINGSETDSIKSGYSKSGSIGLVYAVNGSLHLIIFMYGSCPNKARRIGRKATQHRS